MTAVTAIKNLDSLRRWLKGYCSLSYDEWMEVGAECDFHPGWQDYALECLHRSHPEILEHYQYIVNLDTLSAEDNEWYMEEVK